MNSYRDDDTRTHLEACHHEDGTREEERARVRREQARRSMQRYRQRLKEDRVRKMPTSADQVVFVIEEKPWLYFKRQGPQSQKPEAGNTHAVSGSVLRRQNPTTTKAEKDPFPYPVLRLSRHMDEGQISRDCFYNTLYDRWLPNTQADEVPESWAMLEQFRYDGKALPIQCSTWLKLAFEAPVGHGPVSALKESLLFMSLCTASPEIGRSRQDCVTAGLLAYQRAVRIIQKNLDIAKGPSSLFDQGVVEVQKSNIAYILLACMTCGLTEAFLNSDGHQNLLKHLDGMAVLMQNCGPDSLQDSPLLRAVFYEHRIMYFYFNVLDRKPSFYDKSEWIDFSWKTSEKQARSHMQTLLDIAFRLPTLLEAFDHIATLPRGENLFFSSGVLEDLQDLLNSACKLDDALQYWWRSRLDTPLSSTFQIMRIEDMPPFTPLGRSAGSAPSQIPQSSPSSSSVTAGPICPDRQRIWYANLGVAIAICTHHGIKIHLLHLIYDICYLILARHSGEWLSPQEGFLLIQQAEGAEHQAFELAKEICKSIEYFTHPNRGIIGPADILWPFDAAWMAILKHSVRSQSHPGTTTNRTELEKCSGGQPAYVKRATIDNDIELLSGTNVMEYMEFCQRSADRFRELGLPLLRHRR